MMSGSKLIRISRYSLFLFLLVACGGNDKPVQTESPTGGNLGNRLLGQPAGSAPAATPPTTDRWGLPIRPWMTNLSEPRIVPELAPAYVEGIKNDPAKAVEVLLDKLYADFSTHSIFFAQRMQLLNATLAPNQVSPDSAVGQAVNELAADAKKQVSMKIATMRLFLLRAIPPLVRSKTSTNDLIDAALEMTSQLGPGTSESYALGLIRERPIAQAYWKKRAEKPLDLFVLSRELLGFSANTPNLTYKELSDFVKALQGLDNIIADQLKSDFHQRTDRIRRLLPRASTAPEPTIFGTFWNSDPTKPEFGRSFEDTTKLMWNHGALVLRRIGFSLYRSGLLELPDQRAVEGCRELIHRAEPLIGHDAALMAEAKLPRPFPNPKPSGLGAPFVSYQSNVQAALVSLIEALPFPVESAPGKHQLKDPDIYESTYYFATAMELQTVKLGLFSYWLW